LPARVAFGPWILLAPLGGGGRTEVWLARAAPPRLPRVVALKRLAEGAEEDPEAVRELLDAARVAARAASAAVGRPLDVGSVDGRPWTAWEWVPGVDLAAAMGAIPPALAPAIVAPLCGGLAAIHAAAGRPHGDVSPWNVRLGLCGEVKLLDAGLAVSAGSCGTPGYLAPEQARGGRVGPAADVFAAGAILRDLLAGVRPRTPGAGLGALAAADGGAAGAAGTAPRSALDRIVEAATAAEPGARPSAAALGEALRAHRTDGDQARLAGIVRGCWRGEPALEG
jgi:serine/threonine protein kinase